MNGLRNYLNEMLLDPGTSDYDIGFADAIWVVIRWLDDHEQTGGPDLEDVIGTTQFGLVVKKPAG